MPSYRVTLVIGSLRSGVAAPDVVPAAARLTGELTTVEAKDVRLVGGAPCVVIRYTADDDGMAARVARRVVTGMAAIAALPSAGITRRDGARWVPVDPG